MTEPLAPQQSRLAVLGSPIAHSRSPVIHRAAYQVLDLPWSYEAIECGESELSGLLDSRDDLWLGFSVTMPLKDEARRLSSVLDPVAAESGVVNTLIRILGKGSKPAWAGFNTDVAGLASALEDANLDTSHTIVLGAGATAVSAVLAARSRGAERVSILARRPEAAAVLAHRFDGSAAGFVCDAYALGDPLPASFKGAGCLISTLPGTAADSLQIDHALLQVPLFDVAYDPWPSQLAVRHRTAGTVAHQGIGMLVHQALLQLRIFVGGDPALPLEREPDVLAAMRKAVAAV